MNRDGSHMAASSWTSSSVTQQEDGHAVNTIKSPSYSVENDNDNEYYSDTSTLQNTRTPLNGGAIRSASSSTHFPALVRHPGFDENRYHSNTATLTGDSPTPSTESTVVDSAGLNHRKNEPVTWLSLPCKAQLAVLTIARLSEPLSERSLAAYMFYQLRWFNPSLPDSTIASQGGMLTAAFAAAQFVTAMWWGRAADTPWIGRKRVLLVGLMGTAIASIGVGFSRSFGQAIFFRSLAGALNGNIGVMRTMVSEIIVEKKFQSRAFLLLPMCFNVGVVIGPLLGGLLADPITSFPSTFGPGSVLGGKDGVGWMKSFPYAFPNLFSGIFIGISALCVVLGLDETHDALKNKPDYGRKFGKWLVRKTFRRGVDRAQYRMLQTDDHDDDDHQYGRTVRDEEDGTELMETPVTKSQSFDHSPTAQVVSDLSKSAEPGQQHRRRTGLSLILHTPNVLLTLLTHHLLAFHVSSFNALIFLLLPAPRSPSASNPLQGGLGLPQSQVALSLTILGLIGLPLQLLLYPRLNTAMGTLTSYRTFLPFSVLAYATLPLLVLIPRDRPALMWVGMVLVLASQVLSRTFALTGTVILVNNSSPGRDVLGTVHGVAQSVSSAARCLGPTVGGWVLGWGLRSVSSGGSENGGGNVGVVWWGMAVIAAMNWALLWLIFEGDGKGGKA